MNMLVRFFLLMRLLKNEHKNKTKHSKTSSSAAINAEPQALSQILQPFTTSYRIMPHDMGFRHHLPNYRYLSFNELNITGWLTQLEQENPQINKQFGRLMWVISMQEMVYLKEIKFLDKITVSSQVEGWDKKYLYFKHHFYVKDQLRAIGYTKFVLVNKKGKVGPSALGMEGEQLTDVIKSWNANQMAIKAQ